MTVEERLRATTRAVGDAMRPVRPLRLPADPLPAQYRGVRRSRHWPAWLVPAAAAVAVAVVAAALVFVRDLPGTTTTPGRAAASASGAATATTAPLPGPEAVPWYVVALNGPALTSTNGPAVPTGLVIEHTRTGAQDAMIGATATHNFRGVTGAADDRTFVVDTVVPGSAPAPLPEFDSRAFWLLRLVPSASDPTLTRLPIPLTPPWRISPPCRCPLTAPSSRCLWSRTTLHRAAGRSP